MKQKICLAVILLFASLFATAQTAINKATRERIQQRLSASRSTLINSNNVLRVQDATYNTSQRTVSIQLNEVLAEQPLTRDDVKRIQREVQQLLPPPLNTYSLSILCGQQPLEQLIAFDPSDTTDIANRLWAGIEHKGYPWTSRMSLPYNVTRGLQGRHLALWASHGRYYDMGENQWRWQRPRLFGTSEDLLTQSFVVPFLMPMLENAGAILYSPRERDWQAAEVVVDNDAPHQSGLYRETHGRNGWQAAGPGFAPIEGSLLNGVNPFEQGSYVVADAQSGHRQASQIQWQPIIPQEGDYAVYVSYASLPTSVPDATYTIRHSGISTTVKVNQQMGGGMWVYLGTFHFQAGQGADNAIKLTNQSNYRGQVTADAIRLGGGMGSVARGDSIYPAVRSGLPRHLEAARYAAQYGGAPYKYYATKEATNDYAEDINVRSLLTNYIARGSSYLPGDSGLCVPLEMALAIHSDAGIRRDQSIIGTLGIYTTGRFTAGTYEGLLAEGLLPSGLSRTTSRDLCNMVMTSVQRDIQSVAPQWQRRQMYDRNYSETRLPEVPSMILEMLSHQNYADLLLGHDPTFKFLVSRAIYKGVLRYVSQMHGLPEPVVQPLPVRAFSAMVTPDASQVQLTWMPTDDPLEPSAEPVAYIIYTAIGDRDFDNGQRVDGTSVLMPVEPGELMRFRITTINAGGQSMPSEELATFVPAQKRGRRLCIVNGFTRLAGPQPIDNASERGFRFDIDPGVVSHHSPCYSGRQQAFDPSNTATLGQSGSQYEGILVAGNSFAYPTQHARDLLAQGHQLIISSTSQEALERYAPLLQGQQFVDLILGTQRNDGYSLNRRLTFTPGLKDALVQHISGGGSLLLSGAYLSEELAQDPAFAQNVLHMVPQGMVSIADSLNVVEGMGAFIHLHNDLNPHAISATRCSILAPTTGGFATTLYQANGTAASVAWQNGNQHILAYGFPLEMITNDQLRRAILSASINYLIQ